MNKWKPQYAFVASVESWARERAPTFEDAVLFRTLESLDDVCEPTRRLLDAARSGPSEWSDSDEDAWLRTLADRLLGSR